MTNDEKRLAEERIIEDIRGWADDGNDCSPWNTRWLLDKLAERDAEIKSLRENFADELEKMAAEDRAMIAKLKAALRCFIGDETLKDVLNQAPACLHDWQSLPTPDNSPGIKCSKCGAISL